VSQVVICYSLLPRGPFQFGYIFLSLSTLTFVVRCTNATSPGPRFAPSLDLDGATESASPFRACPSGTGTVALGAV
jgi:hypothetical protein